MTTPQLPPGWRVESLTVRRGGSIDVVVSAPDLARYHVSVSRDGYWEITDAQGVPPAAHIRSAIMATVSAYSLRRAFGGK